MRHVKTRIPSFEELGLPAGALQAIAAARSGIFLDESRKIMAVS